MEERPPRSVISAVQLRMLPSVAAALPGSFSVEEYRFSKFFKTGTWAHAPIAQRKA